MMAKSLVIYTDGASHGNPGPAAIGAIIMHEGKALSNISQAIGIATNNVAEYKAIVAALEKALRLGATDVALVTDSELVERQLKGQYRVRDAALKPLYARVKQLESKFQGLTITHIPGEDNQAHHLASRALRRRPAP